MTDPLVAKCSDGCAKKVAYTDKATAKRKAKEYLKRTPIRQRPYLCQLCGYWHLTSMPLARMEDLGQTLSERLG